jgi:hypothetical protein
MDVGHRMAVDAVRKDGALQDEGCAGLDRASDGAEARRSRARVDCLGGGTRKQTSGPDPWRMLARDDLRGSYGAIRLIAKDCGGSMPTNNGNQFDCVDDVAATIAQFRFRLERIERSVDQCRLWAARAEMAEKLGRLQSLENTIQQLVREIYAIKTSNLHQVDNVAKLSADLIKWVNGYKRHVSETHGRLTIRGDEKTRAPSVQGESPDRDPSRVVDF